MKTNVTPKKNSKGVSSPSVVVVIAPFERREGCEDDYITKAQVSALGKTKKGAEDVFKDEGLKQMTEKAKGQLKCNEGTCAKGKTCVFDYAPADKQACKEITLESVEYKIKSTRWECTQTFWVGCFCVEKK